MSRVVILGAGISGHTAASFAKRWLGASDTVTVVSPNDSYNWIPSNIWVGVGLMRPSQVTFPLAAVYERNGIEFKQASAREIHPEGDSGDTTPYVTVEPTAGGRAGATEKVKYDFLINATGPRLRFDKTEGLGPDAQSLSVCTVEHAVQTAAAFAETAERMRRGERQRFLVGVGHGTPFTGTAASMTVFPIIPDFDRYPQYGRDTKRTFGEIGLARHWVKILLHHLFLYKAKLRPGWPLIPE